MLEKAGHVNLVQARVKAENLARKRARLVIWTLIHLKLFLRLSLEYFREFTNENYQVGLSPEYIQDTSLRVEEEDKNQVLQLNQNTNEPGFIRIKLFSWFKNAANHQLWVAFNEEYGRNDVKPTEHVSTWHQIFGKWDTRVIKRTSNNHP